jgi:hypothetical protein
MYVHGNGQFTQVAVWDGATHLIAIFMGLHAKRTAAAFINGMSMDRMNATF